MLLRHCAGAMFTRISIRSPSDRSLFSGPGKCFSNPLISSSLVDHAWMVTLLGVAVNQWFSRIWLDFILLDKIYIKQYNWITLQYMYFILTSHPKNIHYFNAICMFILPLKSTKDLVLIGRPACNGMGSALFRVNDRLRKI